MTPIIDLHSDLLSYLQMNEARSPLDPQSRSSLPQLKAGGVHLQVLALFSETGPGSTELAYQQYGAFQKLTKNFITECAPCTSLPPFKGPLPVQFLLAFENAAGFAEESDPLDKAFERLNTFLCNGGKLAYVGMTWDGENRFGGGVGSQAGLKEDGKRLIDWLSQNGTALDFSHTSDRLAEEILTYIDQEKLKLPLLASHSNFRAITDLPRNLPDWLALELIQRQGLIGLNLFGPFIRKGDPEVLWRHIEYALSLNAHSVLAFGADFFCDKDFPNIARKYQTDTPFFSEYGNASCYPEILLKMQEKLGVNTETVEGIAFKNAHRFLSTLS